MEESWEVVLILVLEGGLQFTLEVGLTLAHLLLIEIECEEVRDEGWLKLLAHHTLQLCLPQPWMIQDLKDAMGPT